MRARTHTTTRMSYHYDATMTKSRMEMTNTGCALLERMAMTDIETRYAFLQRTLEGRKAVLEKAKTDIREIEAEMRKLTKRHNKHAENKANFEAAVLG